MVDENSLSKLYYSIGEVAKMFKVNNSLIRFWTNEFDAVTPKTRKNGVRMYRPSDIILLNRIYKLVRIDGHTLEGAKKALKKKPISPNNEIQPSTEITNERAISEVLEKLETIKRKLNNLIN